MSKLYVNGELVVPGKRYVLGAPSRSPSLLDHAMADLSRPQPKEPRPTRGQYTTTITVERKTLSDGSHVFDVRLSEPALDVAGLAAIVGEPAVRQDREARVLRCRGKSYLDLLAQRAGDCEAAPDAVVAPADHDQVLAVLQWCAERGVAVVPFGGGTSVVGGLEPLRGPFDAVISLDLARMDGVVDVDTRSLTALLEPGLRLPEADRALAAHGVTLGHIPQSYEWASVGGCVATRSAGQVSTGRGRIDENVVAVRCATPLGELATLDAPASAAGPALRQLVAGSEGVLGVITRVALRVRRLRETVYDAWTVGSFMEGAELLRRLEQGGIAPDIARLSDQEETRLSVALAGTGSLGRKLLDERCLLICGWERAVGRAAAARALVRGGARPLGGAPGRAWERSRFAGPHLRDDLMDRGVLVETLETATTWGNLEPFMDRPSNPGRSLLMLNEATAAS